MYKLIIDKFTVAERALSLKTNFYILLHDKIYKPKIYIYPYKKLLALNSILRY